LHQDPLCLLEVKCRAEVPAWLSAALSAVLALPEPYSKFLRAGQIVHGG
jgi:hypothetical protein